MFVPRHTCLSRNKRPFYTMDTFFTHTVEKQPGARVFPRPGAAFGALLLVWYLCRQKEKKLWHKR